MRTALVWILLMILSASASWAKIGGGEVVYEAKDAEHALYSHDDHVVKLRMGCTECHHRLYAMGKSPKRATMVDMRSGRSCGSCHNDQRAFGMVKNCARCHKK